LCLLLAFAPPGYALLETTGRKTGKPRCTPVGDGRIGQQFWIVAEHGMKAGYVRNVASNPRVRLKMRDGLRARWYTGTAHLLSDDEPRDANAGSLITCRRAPGMRLPCAFSGRNSSRFGLT